MMVGENTWGVLDTHNRLHDFLQNRRRKGTKKAQKQAKSAGEGGTGEALSGRGSPDKKRCATLLSR